MQRLGLALFVVGLFGLLGAFWLPYAGTWLDTVELPIFFATTTIALPDGGRLTATVPSQRVQRYGSDGRFRTGWFVDANGGHFAIGLTSDGMIAVCTGRGHQILFDLDGRQVGHGACSDGPREFPRILQAADFPRGEIDLLPAVPADRPTPSPVAILLVPFWHPVAAWLIALVGLLALRFFRPA